MCAPMECPRAAPEGIARGRARSVPLFFALALLTAARSGIAQTSVPAVTTAIGTCPSAEQTDAQVVSLIPDERRSVLEGIHIEIEDLGPSYRVSVLVGDDRTERTYSDPRRDCDQRARFAAVFAALTLMPPQLGERERHPVEPPPAANPRPLPPRPHPAPVRPLVRVELGASVDGAAPLHGDARATLPGAELRGVLGRGKWGAGLSLGFLARSHFVVDGLEGDLERIPCLAFVRFRHDIDAFAIAVDLGAGATIVRVHSRGLLENRVQIRPEADARMGAQIAWTVAGGLAPFVAARATWVPAAYPLAVAPRREVGSLPHLWLGGMLGLSLAL